MFPFVVWHTVDRIPFSKLPTHALLQTAVNSTRSLYHRFGILIPPFLRKGWATRPLLDVRDRRFRGSSLAAAEQVPHLRTRVDWECGSGGGAAVRDGTWLGVVFSGTEAPSLLQALRHG